MKIEIISDFKQFAALQSEWNDVLEHSEERENVFLRHEFIASWFEAFGAGKKIFILLCFDDTLLAGACPMMLFRDSYKGLSYRRLGFIEDANAPSLNFLCRAGLERRVLDAFISFLSRESFNQWDVAVLNKIPAASNCLQSLIDCMKTFRIPHMVRPSMDSPFIETLGDYQDFLQTTSPKFRKQLRNKVNRLHQQGKVSIEKHETVGEDEQHLRDALSVSGRSWKQSGRTSMVGSPEREAFFRILSQTAQKNGWLRIWILTLDGRPIAMEYHLEYCGRTHAMRGDFDEDFTSLSPGSVLESAIIEHCFANSLKEYDFCGLPYGYKVRWSRRLHERRNVLLYSNHSYATLLYYAQKYGPKVHQFVTTVFKKPIRDGGMVASDTP